MEAFLGALVLVALSARGTLAPAPPVPVLVELFTSEGCSSCPPADALLEVLQREQPVEGAEVIPIGLHVDYFDNLGWKDALSSGSFTLRQQDYCRKFGEDDVYTPQIVVDGQAAVSANDRDLVRRAIVAAASRPHLPLRVTAQATADTVRMMVDLPGVPASTEKIQVMAAVTQDGLTSAVKRGENSGRTLHHVAVARVLQPLDSLTGEPSTVEKHLQIERAWGRGGLNAVVWLQGVKSRQVYGAATAHVTR
jgi:hypothetical protein